MEPYYTMAKTIDGEKFGLVQVYTPDEKQNIISYLVGSNEQGENQLKLYKLSADSNIVRTNAVRQTNRRRRTNF